MLSWVYFLHLQNGWRGPIKLECYRCKRRLYLGDPIWETRVEQMKLQANSYYLVGSCKYMTAPEGILSLMGDLSLDCAKRERKDIGDRVACLYRD